MAYWKDRHQAAQQLLLKKSQKDIDARLKRYYVRLSKQVIRDYEDLYNQVLLKQALGEQVSPATLYQLDKYWQLQAQLRKSLNKFGAYQQELLSKAFETFYQHSYNSIAIPGVNAFNTLNEGVVKQVIDSIWAADGKSWSQRIWKNTSLLQQTLEDGLLECVATGKKTSQLKKVLQERFNVSYSRADTLVRTELAHIETEAAKQRYADCGIQQVEIWADEDERRCPECGKLHQKKYPVGARVPIPNHPNCRCCIVPVIDVDV